MSLGTNMRDYATLGLAFIFACVIVGAVTVALTNAAWKQECVRRGVAGFDRKTGNWEWFNPVAETEEEEPRIEAKARLVPTTPVQPEVKLLLKGEKEK